MTLHNRLPLVRTGMTCILMAAISMVAAPHTPTHASSTPHLATERMLIRPSLRGPIYAGKGINTFDCGTTYLEIDNAGAGSGEASIYLELESTQGNIGYVRATVTTHNASSGYNGGVSFTGPNAGPYVIATADVYTGNGQVTATVTGSVSLTNGKFCNIIPTSASEYIY